MTLERRAFVLGLLALSPALARPRAAAAAEELTMLATVTRVVNLPMIVGLRLLEKEDGVKVAIKDLRSPESVMLAVIEGQGQVATGFAPFYPAIEKGAPVRGVLELSRPEFVVMAKKEIGSVKELHGVRLASHSPKATVQSLLEFYLKTQSGVQPNVVFIPEGSPARAEALLRGAVDAAAFDLTAAQVVAERAPGKFHVLVDFTDQPVSSSSLVVNAAFAKDKPELVQKLVRRMLESYRQGARDPKFWVRERGETLKEVDDAKLEGQLRALVKIFDLNGGLDRMRGPGAVENLSFQVATGNLTGPVGRVARVYLDLMIALPTAALIPLVILSVGINVASSAVIVFVFSAPFVTLNAYGGVRDVRARLVEMARAFGASPGQLFLCVVLPSALPMILAGIRYGLSRAFVGLIVAELLLSPFGLGRLIMTARSMFEHDRMFATVLWTLLLAGAALAALARLEARLLRWRA